jgi:hypothetical protein
MVIKQLLWEDVVSKVVTKVGNSTIAGNNK